MLLISVIVPVFNNNAGEIKRCINSLYNEDVIDKFEIIIVDDGSCASCAKLLDKLASDFLNVKVFHQLNKGVSNARNSGLIFASGEYVTFVDADDMVSRDFIPDAIFLVENTYKNLDVIYGCVEYIKDFEDKKSFQKPYVCNTKKIECNILSDKEKDLLKCHLYDLSRLEFAFGTFYVSRGPVARLVKRVLARQCKFDETLSIGEDFVWNMELLKHAEKSGIVQRLWYYYIWNPKSLTRSFSTNTIGQYEKWVQKLTEYAQNDDMKVCLVNRTTSIAVELAEGYFLADNSFDNVIVASRAFNSLYKRSPWKQTLHFSYAYQSGANCLLKYVIVKAGILLFLLKLKIMLTSFRKQRPNKNYTLNIKKKSLE